MRTTLADQAAGAGKPVVLVPPHSPSQECSGCGERAVSKRGEKRLSVRTPVCPSCGLVLDRDQNAARTMHWAGQALGGLAGLPAGMNREPAGL